MRSKTLRMKWGCSMTLAASTIQKRAYLEHAHPQVHPLPPRYILVSAASIRSEGVLTAEQMRWALAMQAALNPATDPLAPESTP